MGYFERHLSAVGEAVDDGIDRARDKTRDLCDTRGWTERAERAREHAREKREVAQRAASGLWRDLGQDRQRAVLALLAAAAVVVVALIGRSLLINKPAGPTRAEIELVDRARRQSATGGHWAATGKPADATPPGTP